MKPKDHYATLGVARHAPQADIKRAYRKLARKFHPDVSQESDALARFQAVAEAHEALIDPERRAAYDAEVRAAANASPHAARHPAHHPAHHNGVHDDSGSEAFSDFFDSVLARSRSDGQARRTQHGADEHASIQVSLRDAYRDSTQQLMVRLVTLDAEGQPHWQQRQLEVHIPRGVRQGQHMRLKGQGAPGHAGAAAGDLYLEVQFAPDPQFRLEARDVFVDLMLSPWEAALGATVSTPTPEGPVQLTVPPGSGPARRLRLKGRGLPGRPAGDLFAVIGIAVPHAHTKLQKEAYQALASAFPDFDARSGAAP
jgi:curved DNA-binding protein